MSAQPSTTIAPPAPARSVDPSNTPITPKRISTVWPLIVAIFGAGGAWATLQTHSARLDSLDAGVRRIDERQRSVEQGVTTLLERTKSK